MENEATSTEAKVQHYQPITKASPVTPSEGYLGRLCEKTFLSLWSYPSIYRDQGKANGGDGKEICDLLVVFGEHIIIFSDKHCELKNSGNTALDWQRWFRRAIEDSAKQSWGAERWIRQFPTRIFLDRKCTQAIPIILPDVSRANFHLVVVGHGISTQIRQRFGGTGSLMVATDTKGCDKHVEPFYVGDLDPARTFIHIFDDDSLVTVMEARDTISDFVAYLSKRKALFRGATSIVSTGEEELLAVYLSNLNPKGEHDFLLPTKDGKPFDHVMVPEGHWEDFQRSAKRIAQLKRDEISYMWDRLIEAFNKHALKGDQHFVTSGGVKDCEKILRFMAAEPRWLRTTLSQVLYKALERTPSTHKYLGVLTPHLPGAPYYVFLLFPMPDFARSYEQYREVRRNFLAEACKVVKLNYPGAKDIVGLATEPGLLNENRSEDAIYFDARNWTAEMEQEAKEMQEKLGILRKPEYQSIHALEYPDVASRPNPPLPKLKNFRNKPCPCGSGKKYKHCCLDL